MAGSWWMTRIVGTDRWRRRRSGRWLVGPRPAPTEAHATGREPCQRSRVEGEFVVHTEYEPGSRCAQGANGNRLGAVPDGHRHGRPNGSRARGRFRRGTVAQSFDRLTRRTHLYNAPQQSIGRDPSFEALTYAKGKGSVESGSRLCRGRVRMRDRKILAAAVTAIFTSESKSTRCLTGLNSLAPSRRLAPSAGGASSSTRKRIS